MRSLSRLACPRSFHRFASSLISASLCLAVPCAQAQSMEALESFTQPKSKLLLTGGVTSIDGLAGGGLTPWAVTGSYASEHELGVTAAATRIVVKDYQMTSESATISWMDRIEVALARQIFNASAAVPGAMLRQNIFSIKVRLAGDAVLESDSWMPQIAVGMEAKHVSPGNAVGGVLDAVKARRDGTDFYVSATKLFLSSGILVNATIRATKANQNGLLGFGSSDSSKYHFEPEISVAYLLRRDLAIGAEYRAKPDNLKFAGAAFKEDDWKDIFLAWTPNKHISLTGAWVDLGNIVGKKKQTGPYVSAQVAY